MTANNYKDIKLNGKYIALSSEGTKHKFNWDAGGNLTYNGKKAEFDFEEKDGFFFIIYKNKKYPVELVEQSQNKFQIVINNVSYDISVETPISFKRKKFFSKRNKGQQRKQVTAPMPGKIVEVFAEEGKEINAGEPVLILEAMKMQNEIVAQEGGVVAKINVKNEENVMKDDVLVELN